MKYFTIEELTHSTTAQRLGIDNQPSPEVIANLSALVENVLDPLREALGKPIKVNSGYRSKALNQAVGGSPNSQHCKGQAVDFVIAGAKPGDMALAFGIIKNRLPYDQLIDEYGLAWIHVSYRADGKNRRQVIRKR